MWAISIASHKTTSTHGRAVVYVTLFGLRVVFTLVDMVQRNFGIQSVEVFLTPSGTKPFSTSKINICMQTTWIRSGLQEKCGQMTYTNNRKSITTTQRTAHPETAETIAKQFMHRKATSDMYYDLTDMTESGAMVVAELINDSERDLMTGNFL